MDLQIDTTDPTYQAQLAAAIALRDYMKPRLKAYKGLNDVKQAWWRSRDPLLRGVLNWAEKISLGKEGD